MGVFSSYPCFGHRESIFPVFLLKVNMGFFFFQFLYLKFFFLCCLYFGYCSFLMLLFFMYFLYTAAQAAGAVEYTDCISAEELDPTPTSVQIIMSNHFMPRLKLWIFSNVEYLFIAIAPRSTQTQSGRTWLGPIYRSNRTNCVFKLLM